MLFLLSGGIVLGSLRLMLWDGVKLLARVSGSWSDARVMAKRGSSMFL